MVPAAATQQPKLSWIVCRNILAKFDLFKHVRCKGPSVKDSTSGQRFYRVPLDADCSKHAFFSKDINLMSSQNLVKMIDGKENKGRNEQV